MTATRNRVAAMTAAVAILLDACQAGSGVDKSGGDTVTLQLATIDDINDNVQSYGPRAFIDNLIKASRGRLRVEVLNRYGGGAADAESDLVRAIASGEVDGGWPATRAFANAGVAGLAVVEAPMTITSYAAEKALVSGPLADKLLSRLGGSGVVGLGLAVGPLRRPFAAYAPLVALADWRGASFRVFNSPVQAEAVRALGATPVNVGHDWIDAVGTGALRGAEFDLTQYAHNGYGRQAGNVTANVILWPKVFVLSFSQKRFDALTPKQRSWVREAARQAVRTSVDSTYDETTLARELCEQGVRFPEASSEQIKALRSAMRPVIDRLAAPPGDAAFVADLEAIARQHATPERLDVAAECRQGVSSAQTDELIPAAVSALPDGIYRVEITTKDVAAAGLDNSHGNSGTWTLHLGHGTYETSCRPIANPGIDCGREIFDGPLDVGDLRGTENTVWFVYRPDRLAQLTGCTLPVSGTRPGACSAGSPYRATWAFDGESLRFSRDPGAMRSELTIEPWRKIG